MKSVQVAVVMGSDSDLPVMRACISTLSEFNISYEVHVMSAHRTPHEVSVFARGARKRGVKVIIAGAGSAAHLAGVIASHTTLPVIGVPLASSDLKGLDALLATVQMPAGIPVATVALGKGGAKNAGVLACQILALKYPDIAEGLRLYRKNITQTAIEKAEQWMNDHQG